MDGNSRAGYSPHCLRVAGTLKINLLGIETEITFDAGLVTLFDE